MSASGTEMGQVKIARCGILGKGGVEKAGPFLDLVIRFRGGKPFIPKGVHRLDSFSESDARTIRMMARRSKFDRPA